jgi:HSP20 family protein
MQESNAMVQIVRRHPFHPFAELQAEMDRLFGGVIPGPTNGTRRQREARIDLELVETDEAFVVRAEVPGFEPEKLEVTATGDRLVLSGEKLDPLAGNADGRRYSERVFGAVRRELALPADIDPSKVSAQHAHGVLTITLPKAGTDRPRRIEVKAS